MIDRGYHDTMLSRVRSFLLPVSFTVAVFAGCSNTGGSGDCQPGTEFCECLGGSACGNGLECIDGYCLTGAADEVDTESTGTTTDTTTTDTTTTDATTTDATTDDETTMGSEDGGPVIIDFGTNVSVLEEDQSVVFTATVNDPDGPDDIQGGSLKDASESITFGAFQDVGNGTYEITVSWAEIDQAIGINFEGMQTLTFTAVFFDNGGHKGFDQTSVDLTCGPEDSAMACDGQCVLAATDNDHCGTCGNACDGFNGCTAGTCEAAESPCLVAANFAYTGCDEYCAAMGEVCTDDGPCWGGGGTTLWKTNNCSDVGVPLTYTCGALKSDWNDWQTTLSVNCCCTVGAQYP